MTKFVLVPGGWHGGWWFEPLTRRLRELGHEAYPLTLTGVDERHHLVAASVNLDTHIEDVLRVLEAEQIEDAVLVAHSYGGTVVTGTADRAPERIGALVYVDAQVPRDDESLWSMTTEDFRHAFIEWAAADGYAVAPPPGLDPVPPRIPWPRSSSPYG